LIKKAKDREFLLDDLIFKWDAKKEDVEKHGNFDHIWCGPFRVIASEGKNLFLLENLDGQVINVPINRCYLKHFMK
jgi:hypothetical protein